MSNKEIAILEKKMTPVTTSVLSLVVTDAETEHRGVELLSQLNKIGDVMKATKAKIYDPAWATVVAIREEWRPRESMLKEAIDAVRGKLTAYRTEVEAKKAKILDRVGDGKGKLKLETAVNQVADLGADGAVQTEKGTVKYKTVKKFEITDILQLSTWNRGAAIIPNEIVIREAMKRGLELPGVRYFEEQVPTNYR